MRIAESGDDNEHDTGEDAQLSVGEDAQLSVDECSSHNILLLCICDLMKDF